MTRIALLLAAYATLAAHGARRVLCHDLPVRGPVWAHVAALSVVAWLGVAVYDARPVPATAYGPDALATQQAALDRLPLASQPVAAQYGVTLPTPVVLVDGAPAKPLPDTLPPVVLAGEPEIRQAAADTGLDARALALLWAIEAPRCAGGDTPGCTSPAGARGPGQVMSATAVELEAATGWPCASQPYDTLTSLRCGATYYVQRLRQARDVWTPDDEGLSLGVAGVCYNAGGGSAACATALAAARRGDDPCAAVAGYARGEPASWCRQMSEGWRRIVSDG